MNFIPGIQKTRRLGRFVEPLAGDTIVSVFGNLQWERNSKEGIIPKAWRSSGGRSRKVGSVARSNYEGLRRCADKAELISVKQRALLSECESRTTLC